MMIHQRNKKNIFLITFVIGFLCLCTPSGASAFFDDIETAAVSLQLSTLDLVATDNGWTPIGVKDALLPGDSVVREIEIANNGSLDFQYKIKISNLSGAFCQNLNLKATLNGEILYDGKLADFSVATTTDLGTIDFVASSPAHGFNQACDFDLVFIGWQMNLDNENLGFSDEETISNSIVGGRDQNDVVLNEFLPNPIGLDTQDGILGEWVEFYNNSNHAIDMTGWYTEDAIGASHRRTISAATTYGGQTIIGAKGSGSEWLVLFMSDDILNNDGDTINLYDNYGGLVDTYSYSGSNYNINDTLGGTNNLVAYLPFNNDLLDKSGNNNNGTNSGTTFTTGKVENGLTLGSSKYVEIPDSPSLDTTDQITLEAWVYPTAWDTAHENSILTKAGNGEYGVWNLHHTNSGFRFELSDSPTSHYDISESSASNTIGVWYHVIGTFDGNEMKIYVNGVLKGAKIVGSNVLTANNSPLRIGEQYWYTPFYSYWSGKIDEVKIYNRALSATEVLEHYNTTSNALSSTPENKSYARIPDGIGNWVDPIPTPGKPNIVGDTEVVPELGAEELIELGGIDVSQISSESFEIAASGSADVLIDVASESEEIITVASGSVDLIEPTPEPLIEEQPPVQDPAPEEVIIEPVVEIVPVFVEAQSSE